VCSISRNAQESGLSVPSSATVKAELLQLPEELALAKMLARYPEVIVSAATEYEPHRVTFYLQELAAKFHSYYNQHRVIVDDAATSEARLYLVNAVKIVLHNALRVLGVTAPEQM
jgi:arginyl-tRNA synthetase